MVIQVLRNTTKVFILGEVQLDFAPKMEVFHMLLKDVIIKVEIDFSKTV